MDGTLEDGVNSLRSHLNPDRRTVHQPTGVLPVSAPTLAAISILWHHQYLVIIHHILLHLPKIPPHAKVIHTARVFRQTQHERLREGVPLFP